MSTIRYDCQPAGHDAQTMSPHDFSLFDLDYELPEDRVAQAPLARRDDSRMLIVNRQFSSLHHSNIRDFPHHLEAGDLLVLNDTRVLPARFTATRTSGGRVHGLFLEDLRAAEWLVMLEGSRRLRVGETLCFEGSSPVTFVLAERQAEGKWRIQVQCNEPANAVLERVGRTPLPPYIGRKNADQDSESRDRERYQTVYARSPGAVAAPTAGLHLSDEVLARIRERGVSIAYVTLHVGAGTFKPIAVSDVAAHPMHSERFAIPDETIAAWQKCRNQGHRVVAVGTTVVRVLESVLGTGRDSSIRSGSTNLFIYPPYRITTVDAMLTNFHLPRSTLLALVMAFAGLELIRVAYRHAIDSCCYRFYSYGDAMLIE
jgi:S-adenosylmethionine:tRNA ribosyltransferase-isomerase